MKKTFVIEIDDKHDIEPTCESVKELIEDRSLHNWTATVQPSPMGEVKDAPKCGIESSIERVHWLIHDASYAISQGDNETAHKKLAEADALTHDLCSQPMEVKDAEAIEIDFGNHVRARIERVNGEYKVTGAMNGYGAAIHESAIKIKPTAPTLQSQLQPPVISAPDFLKEKGISVAKIFQTENIAYDEFKRPKREFVSLHDLLTEYLQRQGQKTNQTKL